MLAQALGRCTLGLYRGEPAEGGAALVSLVYGWKRGSDMFFLDKCGKKLVVFLFSLVIFSRQVSVLDDTKNGWPGKCRGLVEIHGINGTDCGLSTELSLAELSWWSFVAWFLVDPKFAKARGMF